jgi:hypothetical protein
VSDDQVAGHGFEQRDYLKIAESTRTRPGLDGGRADSAIMMALAAVCLTTSTVRGVINWR